MCKAMIRRTGVEARRWFVRCVGIYSYGRTEMYVDED